MIAAPQSGNQACFELSSSRDGSLALGVGPVIVC
jgi:hypothetical protein